MLVALAVGAVVLPVAVLFKSISQERWRWVGVSLVAYLGFFQTVTLELVGVPGASLMFGLLAVGLVIRNTSGPWVYAGTMYSTLLAISFIWILWSGILVVGVAESITSFRGSVTAFAGLFVAGLVWQAGEAKTLVLFRMVGLAGLMSILAGVLQLFVTPDLGGILEFPYEREQVGLERPVTGLQENPNAAAYYYLIALAAAWIGAARVERRAEVGFWMLVGIGCAAMIVLTGSRSGIVGLMVVVVAGVLVWAQERASRLGLVVGLLVAGILGLAFGVEFVRTERVVELPTRVAEISIVESNHYGLWVRGWGLVSDSPILGAAEHGFGEGGLNYHNDFVQVAAEQGLPGLVLFLALLWLMVTYIRRGLGGGGSIRSVSLLGGGIVVVACIVGFSHTIFHHHLLFWLMAGLAAHPGTSTFGSRSVIEGGGEGRGERL